MSSAQVGPGTAGAPTQVTISLRDASNNPVAGAGDKISVTASGANTASGPVSERVAAITVQLHAGHRRAPIRFRVPVDGTDVPGSPFSSTVSAGPADAAHTRRTCRGLSFLHDDHRDCQGRATTISLNRGGDVVAITYEAGSVAVTDNGDGTYTGGLRAG